MSIETMTKIATTTLSSTATTVTFSNIPQTYTDLILKVSSRTDNNAVYGAGTVRPNGATTNLTGRAMEGYSTSSVTTYTETSWRFEPNGATTTSSSFGNAELYIKDYTGSNYKSAFADTVTGNNATEKDLFFKVWLWSSTEAIKSLDIVANSSQNWQTHSTFTLYGIKNARKTAGNSIKATGVNISFDGTYVVHTFNSSGTFTPTVALSDVDYLVVAGGGAGGAWYAGGGGAGGLRSTVTATGGGGSLESAISMQPNVGYTITVGAGGAGISVGTANNGSNSSLSGTGITTITSTGGGRGGGFTGSAYITGASGGSGGGGAINNAGGSGTSNQGYAGGSGSGSPAGAGGGGGAGAVGVNGITNSGGNGGAGVAVAISGSLVTYAGGGGGATESGTSTHIGTGGSGGGGNGGYRVSNGVTSQPTSGTTNTGSGGGGASDNSGAGVTSGSGGSGVVIIRYKA